MGISDIHHQPSELTSPSFPQTDGKQVIWTQQRQYFTSFYLSFSIINSPSAACHSIINQLSKKPGLLISVQPDIWCILSFSFCTSWNAMPTPDSLSATAHTFLLDSIADRGNWGSLSDFHRCFLIQSSPITPDQTNYTQISLLHRSCFWLTSAHRTMFPAQCYNLKQKLYVPSVHLPCLMNN